MVVVVEATVEAGTAASLTGAVRAAVFDRDGATTSVSTSLSVLEGATDVVVGVGAGVGEGVTGAFCVVIAVVVVLAARVVVVVVVGGGLVIVRENVAVEVPPELVAVTVYDVDACVAVGVPLMRPVDELNDSPDGSAGEMVYDCAGPPALTMV